MDDLPELALDPQLVECFERTAQLQEAVRDFAEALDEHPELAVRFDALMDALNAWLSVAATARD
jgi:hypothetical protein